MSKSEFVYSLEVALEEIKQRCLYRDLAVSVTALDFTSNDYLGLGNLIDDVETRKVRGASASRVLSGTTESHLKFEEELARYAGVDSALLFGSGYLANIGTLSALISRRDLVLSDKYCHRSLLEGIKLSLAAHGRYRHNDMSHLEELLNRASSKRSTDQRIFIVTESVFSMDGDLAPLKEIKSLCLTYDALLVVDEAHAFGVFGALGRGRCYEEKIVSDTLAILANGSKSLCAYGGFFMGDKIVKEFLVNRSSSFIYSTALPPYLCDILAYNLQVIRTHPELGVKALENAEFFRQELDRAGVYEFCSMMPASHSQIVPLVLGTEDKVIRLKEALRMEGISTAAIRPPSVPEGTSRIRFSIRADHEKEDLRRVAYLVSDLLKDL